MFYIHSAVSRASSVPSSPVGHTNKLQRSATNPFFNNVPAATNIQQPAKQPPKYDEVVISKTPIKQVE